MNVLYISYDGMTDPLGQSQVIPYLVGLTKKGYSFTILSCEKKDNYKKNKPVIADILATSGINWEPIFYTKKPPVLSTIYDYWKLKHTATKLHRKVKFDIIHCRSYISALVGLWMNRKYQLPFVFDMRGFWADERVDGGLWSLSNPVFKMIYRFFKKKELEFLKKSAAIVSLTHAGKKEILNWEGLNISPEKITVIPCCVDTGLFTIANISLAQQNMAKQKLQIGENDFVLGYLGSIGTWYMLDEMMQFFAELKKQITNTKFVFITQDNAAGIIAKARQYQIDDNDLVITPAARDEVPLMISLFNYGLFFIKPSYSKAASSPTKQGEIMAMEVPVICNSGVGDSDHIIEKYHSGVVVKNFDYAAAIQMISSSAANFDKKKIRAGAEEYFSLNNGVEQYARIYQTLK